MGRLTNEERILRHFKQPEPANIASSNGEILVLPNHSGDHSAGLVLKTPVKDTDIVNKTYVDTNFVKLSPSSSQTITGGTIFGNTSIDPDAYTNKIIIGNIADGSGWAANGVAFGTNPGAYGAVAATLGYLYLAMQNGAESSMRSVLVHNGVTGKTNLPAGNVGINTWGPDKSLEINSASGACLRLTYNDDDGSATNYTDFSVSSAGALTITPSGSGLTLAANKSLSTSGAVVLSGLSTGAGAPATILTNFNLYVDTNTGIVYCN